MAWSEFPLSAGDDVTAVAVAQEIVAAINERATVVGEATLTTPAVNDAWFSASNVAVVQQKIEDLVPYFVDHTDNGGDWDGVAAEANVGPAWVWGGAGSHDITIAAHADVGSGNGDWTRKYGAGGASTAYGPGQQGDILAGPYLNEMYRTLNMLRWRKDEGSRVNNGTDTSGYTGTFIHATANAAWADVVANYPGSWSGTGGNLAFSNSALSFDGSFWRGSARNRRRRVRINGLPTSVQSSIDIYGDCDTSTFAYAEWDDDGLGFTQGVINFAVTIAESGAADRTSSYVGDSLTMQDRPSAEPSSRGWGIELPGFGVSTGATIHKYDGPNGFTKIT